LISSTARPTKYHQTTTTTHATTGITTHAIAIHCHGFLSRRTINHSTNATISNGIPITAPIIVRLNSHPTIAHTIDAIANPLDGGFCHGSCGVFSAMLFISFIE
jgi:hypothetical protein